MKTIEALPFSQALRALGRPVFYYPVIGRALGSNDAAVFLGNFMYWEGKQADKKSKWIFKSAVDILEETGLKRSRQENAREILSKFGIIEEKKEDFPPKIYYRFNWETLDKVVSEYIVNNNKDEFQEEEEPEKKTTKKATPKPKKEKVLTEEKLPTVIYQMKGIFDEVYSSRPGFEMGYEWSKDKKGGMDWCNLKRLRDTFYNRSIERKKKELIKLEKQIPDQIEISDEELLSSWRLFLNSLSDYHKERNFTPALLYKNFNPIVNDIITTNKTKQPVANAGEKSGARSKAQDYV